MNIKISLIMALLLFATAFGNVFQHKHELSSFIHKLPKVDSISCKYKQDKYIKSANTHLKSGGDFKFDKNKGVVFSMTYPVKSTVSYTTSDYKHINSIIKAIANKNYAKIEKDFDFFFLEDDNNWVLGLKPKAGSKVQGYINSIEIEGDKAISKIIITSVDFSTTTITFYNG